MTQRRLFPEIAGQLPSGARAALYAFAAALGVARLWVDGYAFGAADHSWQVPLVRGLAAGEFPADYIFNPPLKLSFFFPIAAFFTRHFAIEYVYFAGYLAASIAAAVAVYALAEKILDSPPAAILAVALLSAGKDVAAGATTWDAMLLPRVAAMPLMLFSWRLLLDERPAWAGALMGGAFALHPLTGVYGGAIAAAMLMGKRDWRALLNLAAGAAAPIAATAAYVLPSKAPLFEAGEAWRQAMLARNMHHLAPSSHLLLAGLLVYGLFAATRLAESGGRPRLLLAAVGAAAAVFMYAGGAVAIAKALHVEEPVSLLLYPPILATLQPMRIAGPLGILIFIATAGILWRSMHRGLVERLAATGAAAALAFANYHVGFAFLLAAVLAEYRSHAARAAALVLFVAAVATEFALHKTLFALTTGVLVAAAMVTLTTRTRVRSAGAALTATVLMIGAVSPEWAALAARRAFGPSAVDPRYTRDCSLRLSAEPAVLEAARWVKENAKSDEVTIVPPDWESFRVASERAVYGTYKDGTLVFFNESLAGEWLDRMSALEVEAGTTVGSRMPPWAMARYDALPAKAFTRAAAVSPARYIVRTRPLEGFEKVYAGEHVNIYRIGQEGSGGWPAGARY